MADEPQPEKLGTLNRLEDLSKQGPEEGRSARASHVRLPANWSLIWEKTPADKAYLIVEGEVSVRKGKEEVARLGPGDVIGEMAIVGHKLRSASVVSLTPLEVIHFTKEALERAARRGARLRRGAARHHRGPPGRPAGPDDRRRDRTPAWPIPDRASWSTSSRRSCSARSRR